MGRKVVSRFGVELAVLKAEPIVLVAILLRHRCHLGAGFRHAGHFVRGADRVQTSRAGVGRRCQLNCQKGDYEEPGHPEPAKERAHAMYF